MGIQTQRVQGYAQVTIDDERCDACGLCVAVCKGAPLSMVAGAVRVDQAELFGCFACGQCMAVCPQDCIRVEGRDLFTADMFPLPSAESRATYTALTNLMASRRSVRNYEDKAVPRDVLEAIIAAVSSAPMGLPPSDVEVLVLENRAAVQRFTADVIAYFKQHRWLFSDPVLWLLRPFMRKETAAMFKDFLAVAIRAFLEKSAQGEDWLTYGAPCALYFYTSPYADPADPTIAATYAMLAAESLGLGSCMLGTIPYCFQYSRALREKYGIPHRSQQGLMLILGYPAVTYQRGVQRRLGRVRFLAH
jgi:nitroreductase/NAD-dependent dihydropyrimidine dehydrogenase PreA subunit